MNGGNYHCSSVTALTRVKLTSDYPTSPPSVQPLCWRHIRESFGRNVRYELDYGQVGNASIGRHRHLSFSTVCSKVERRGSRKCPTMTHRQRRARLCYRNSTAQHAVVFRNVAQLSLLKCTLTLNDIERPLEYIQNYKGSMWICALYAIILWILCLKRWNNS